MMFFKSNRSNGSGIEFYSPVSDSNHEQEKDSEDTEEQQEETEEGK